MAQRPLWWLTVSQKIELSPFLWKISLSGPSLVDFPTGREGDYVKLLLPKSPDADIRSVDPEDPDLSPFFKRSYTVSEFESETLGLSLYVTRHDAEFGPAALWANEARVGDEVLITGPGPVDQLDSAKKSYLLIGDLPSLGALVANLRRLPSSAEGHLIFESEVPVSLLEDACPSGIVIHWVAPESGSDRKDAPLLDCLRSIELSTEDIGIWAACEYSNMKQLRHFFVEELGMPRTSFYLSSYFKRGATDEQHKQTRRDEGYKD